jgi:hypothetical protein
MHIKFFTIFMDIMGETFTTQLLYLGPSGLLKTSILSGRLKCFFTHKKKMLLMILNVLGPYLLLALQLCPVPRGYLRFQSSAHGAHICYGGHRQPRPRLRFSPTHKVPTLFQISGPV